MRQSNSNPQVTDMIYKKIKEKKRLMSNVWPIKKLFFCVWFIISFKSKRLKDAKVIEGRREM